MQEGPGNFVKYLQFKVLSEGYCNRQLISSMPVSKLWPTRSGYSKINILESDCNCKFRKWIP